MADKSGLQHVPHSTDLVVSEVRSGLIIRGFNDAKSLLAGKVASPDEDDAQTHYDHGLTFYALQDYAQATRRRLDQM
jgi:hypothetical protein